MKELSLNILDIVENSIKSGAKNINLEIGEDNEKDLLIVTVKDDGKGMDDEFVKIIFDPFTTTSTNKKVGLGLPLLREEAENCGGGIEVHSEKGKGTTVVVKFKHSHIDRPPMGDLASTILTVIATNSAINLLYTHTVNGKVFKLSTKEIREIVGDVAALRDVTILKWLGDYVRENIKTLYGGEGNGKN